MLKVLKKAVLSTSLLLDPPGRQQIRLTWVLCHKDLSPMRWELPSPVHLVIKGCLLGLFPRADLSSCFLC